MKKLVKEQLNENMGYTSFFGKDVTHKNALNDRIRGLLTNIIMEERGISEKAFESYDKVIDEVKHTCDNNLQIYEDANQYYKDKRRLQRLAEICYEKYFK